VLVRLKGNRLSLIFKPGVGHNAMRRSFVLTGTDKNITVAFLIPYEDVAQYHHVPGGTDPEPFLDRKRALACAERTYRTIGPRSSTEMLVDYVGY
jgi:hypothetical protein